MKPSGRNICGNLATPRGSCAAAKNFPNLRPLKQSRDAAAEPGELKNRFVPPPALRMKAAGASGAAGWPRRSMRASTWLSTGLRRIVASFEGAGALHCGGYSPLSGRARRRLAVPQWARRGRRGNRFPVPIRGPDDCSRPAGRRPSGRLRRGRDENYRVIGDGAEPQAA
jgi:hypothetical protein